MPLYEYECEKCGARFEVIQRFSDSPVEACRVCGGSVHKLISAPAIQFKGTGWYVTDYAKKNGSSPSPSSPPVRESKSDSASTTSTTSTASTPSSSASSTDTSSTAKKD